MYSPAQVTTHPPALVEWKGRKISVNNASVAIRQLGITPLEAQEFLRKLNKVAPDLVTKEGSFYVSLDMAAAWLGALKERWTADEPFVEAEEANRRALVCLECPLHVAMSGCNSCGAINRFTMRVPGGLEHDVGACGACGCHLPTKVWLGEAVIASDPRDISYPPNCWMSEQVDADNHSGDG